MKKKSFVLTSIAIIASVALFSIGFNMSNTSTEKDLKLENLVALSTASAESGDIWCAQVLYEPCIYHIYPTYYVEYGLIRQD